MFPSRLPQTFLRRTHFRAWFHACMLAALLAGLLPPPLVTALAPANALAAQAARLLPAPQTAQAAAAERILDNGQPDVALRGDLDRQASQSAPVETTLAAQTAAPLAQAATLGLGNWVWKDTNANGLQDSGEEGIPGVQIGLYDNSGKPVQCPQQTVANLALNKTATASSAYGASYTAINAVDSNLGNMAVTNADVNAWWQVDLGQSAIVRQVIMYARPDGAHAQTEQIYVEVSNQPFASPNLATTLADANVWSSPLIGSWSGASFTVTVPSYAGRYVRIQHSNTTYLALAEVQVMGSTIGPVSTFTDANGFYAFTDADCMQPNTTYALRIDRMQMALAGLGITTLHAGNVISDSDAVSQTIGATPYAVITATVPSTGTNTSYDAGFVDLGIGNTIWLDNNNDGRQDPNEPGIAGVTVGLYNPNGTAVQCVQTQTRYYLDTGGGATDSAGDLNWSGQAWTFSSAGTTTGGNPGNTVYAYGNGTATRTVNLSVFGAYPNIGFDYAYVNATMGYSHVLEYSTDNGSTWTALKTYSANGGTSWQYNDFTLPSLSANVRIRIRGTGGATGNRLNIDNLRIQGGVNVPATAVTDGNGHYNFNGNCVQPNTAYQLRVDQQQLALSGLYLTTPNVDGVTSNDPLNDASDSDASSTVISNTTFAVINLTAPVIGLNNSYAFGFVESGIGNYVWKDDNVNGLQDSSEPGISGVVVSLYNPNNTPVQCVQGQTGAYLDQGGGATDSQGTLNWSGQAWTFSSAGTTSGGNPGNTLYAYGNGTATRAVDLSVFGAYPTLSYDYAYANLTTGYSHVVEYSLNGGTTWTTLATYVAGSPTTYQTERFTLPSLSANAAIRVRGTAGASANYLRIDNLRIEGGLVTPATTVTNSNGRYSFDGACVQPGGVYQVRIDTTQRPLKGLALTTANAGNVTNNDPNSDITDSDATSTTISNTVYAVINAIVPAAGINYGYDVGFTPLEIGNYVWKDNNANGVQDAGEPGLAGVTVGLYTNAVPSVAVQCVQDETRYYLDTGGTAADNLGSLNWSQSWLFNSAGSTIGGNPGNTIYAYGNGSATRAVNLAVFGANPTLSFDYAYLNTATGYSHDLEYSTDGGSTWVKLATYTSSNNTAWRQASFTLPTLSANVSVRIRGTAGATGNRLNIDNLRIEGGIRTPATAVTDANGYYRFDGAHCVQPNTTYRLSIDMKQAALRGLSVTTANGGSDDTLDSDAHSVTSNSIPYAQIDSASAPATGVNDTNDFGFAPVEIGDFVWQDNNDNGLQDSVEPGIPGVTLHLYDALGSLVQCVQDQTSDYLDQGNSATDSQGPLNWSLQAWTFSASTAGVAAGGNPGNAVYVFGNGSARRAVDLSPFAGTYPTISYDYAYLNSTGGYYHTIEYSTNNGATWTALATYGAGNGTAWQQARFTLPVAAGTLLLQIRGTAGAAANRLLIDNLRIEGNVAAAATAVTDANGHYRFDGRCVQPSTPGNSSDYQVQVDTTQTVLTGLHLATANVNAPISDTVDSDAVTLGNSVVVAFSAPLAGVNDSYDLGFVPVQIGDKIWKDSNGNGVQDGGEPGIAGVTVGLYDANGSALQCPQAGRYDTYRDDFTAGNTSGSTGTLNWAASWNHNSTVVVSGMGNPGNALRLYSANTSYATRAVDLAVFTGKPTLRFDYNFGGYAQSYDILYSSDDGATFQTLATLSDNNNSYTTITYTLPITAATAQFRIQGVAGKQFAYFDNFTIEGQKTFPVTTVTDANGRYIFTGANCVQPNTPYQVRIDMRQAALFGLALTTQDAGGVTSNDPVADNSDSDASGVLLSGIPTAQITLTAPAVGANDGYDIGFTPMPVGALQINKTVRGSAAPSGWSFTLSSVNCPLPAGLTNPLTTATGGSGSVTFANLLVQDGIGNQCSYQLSENSQNGWFLNYGASDALLNLQVTANTTTPVRVINDPVQTCNVASGNVGGVVFQDFNMDGQQNSATTEPGFTAGGIIVRAYGLDNQLLGQTSIQPNGAYVFANLPNLTTTGVRLEFENLPAWLRPTAYHGAATTNRTSQGLVWFANAATCNADLGVSSPTDYCQANPDMCTSVQINGNINVGTPANTVVKFGYNLSGGGSNFGLSPRTTPIATKGQVGSVWGMAYSRTTKLLYASAFLKRHVGVGPSGLGAIYAIDPQTGATALFADLAALGANVGSVLSNGARGLGIPQSPNADASTWDQIYKVGIGDIDLSEDESILYAISLNDKTLYALNVPSGTLANAYPIPDPGCVGGAWRPFAMKTYHGDVYVGGVCDAQSSQNVLNMKAYVYRFTPGSNTFTKVLSFVPSNRLPWPNDYTKAHHLILSDIEFDIDGSMMLGMADRMADQIGYLNYSPLGSLSEGDVAAGDLLRARNVGGTYVLESPSYYNDNSPQPWLWHQNSGRGALAFKVGSGEVASTVVDPSAWVSGGVGWFDNQTGQVRRTFQVYNGNSVVYWGKAHGMGDIETLCDSAPLEIGNRVWNDNNNPNGVQDPGEPGIPGVVVNLYTITGTVIATTTTDLNGEYYFNNSNVPGGLKQNTDYTIRINRTQTSLNGLLPTLLNQVVNNAPDPDEHDSDGDPAPYPGYVATSVHTGSAGQNDYSYDFGFRNTVQIGNRLWIESDSDGDANTGTVIPVAGQVVTATSSAGQVYTATTDSRGYYTITVKANASYTVTTGVPAGTTPSTVITTVATDANAAANDNKNHLNTGTQVTVGTQNNYSIDFGFHAPLAKFGDRVWLESDADGLANTGTITPLAGMVITATNGTTVYTTTTTVQGYYSFTVPSGAYTVTYGSAPSSYGVIIPSATPGGSSESGNAGIYAETGNPDRSHANRTRVTLTAGQANWHVDFGFWQANPGIALAKYTNGNRATHANDNDVPAVAPGAVVTWTYVVTNTGNVPLAMNVITVTDNVVGKLLISGTLQTLSAPYGGVNYADNSQVLDGVLGVGERFTLRVTWIAPNLSTKNPATSPTDEWVNGCDNGSTTIDESRTTYENLATVIIPSHVVTDTSHFCNPPNLGIALAKFTNGNRATKANDNDVPQVAPGAVVTWTYLVTNTGDTPLAMTAITVTDNVVGKLMVGGTLQTLSAPYAGASYADNSQVLDGVLGVGEHFTLRVTWIAPNLSTKNPATSTTDEWVNGCDLLTTTTIDESRTTYENLATVLIPGRVMTDTSHFCNPPNPGIALAKFTNGNRATKANDNDVPQVAPGAVVTWTYLVTNTGDTPLAMTAITVTDNVVGKLMAGGALQTLSAPYGGASYADNSQVLDGVLGVGEYFSLRVTWVAPNLSTKNPATSTTDEWVNGCDLLTTTTIDESRTTYENLATVLIGGRVVTDTSHFCNPTNPSIALAKFTNGNRATKANDNDVPQVAPGAVVTWTYLVTNTGDTPLAMTAITVTDNVVGKLLVGNVLQTLSAPYGGVTYADNSQVLDGVLGVGEHFTLRVTWVAPDLSTKNPTTSTTDEWVNGCDLLTTTTIDESRTTYENLATVIIPGRVMTDTSHFCNPTNPGIALAKFTNGNRATHVNDNDVPQVAPGAVVTWTYLVTNTGDTPLAMTAITVTDNVVGKLLVGGALQTLSAPYGGASYADNSQVLDGVLGVGEHFTLRVTWVAPNLSTKNPATSTTDEWVNGCDLLTTTTIDESRTTYENLATVIIPGRVMTDTSHFCNPTNPGITIAKFTNGNRATKANDNDVPQVAPGAVVTWTYLVTNTGDTPLAMTAITVTDNVVGKLLVSGALQTLSAPYGGVTYADNSQVLDGVLGVGEHFTLRVTWVAPNLSTKNPATSPTDEWVNGCDLLTTTTIDESRTTYENLATVIIPGRVVTDTSHFCNPTNPGIAMAKFTNGKRATHANDNDVPQVAPGAVVTWTYLVTNTGDTPLAMTAITVTDNVVGKLLVGGALQTLSAPYGGVNYADNSQVLDGVLGVGEHFTLRVTWIAPDLSTNNPATSTTDEWVNGCDKITTTTIDESRTTYENLATVIIPGRVVTDTSHFCNPALLSLGNLVWYDNNNDGLVNVTEKGLADVVVKLYQNGSATPLATTKTDANGKYLFANLNEGAYIVEVIPPTYVNSRGVTKYYVSSSDANRPDANKPDNRDNDDNGLDDLANPSVVRSAVVTLVVGAEPSNEFDQNQPINGVVDRTPPANSNFHVDFGLYQPGVIRTRAWVDTNLDGVSQSSEPALPNTTVSLFSSYSVGMTRQAAALAPARDIYGQLVPTQTTDSDGYVFFDNLPPGEYVLQVTPPEGYALTKGGADPDDDNPNDSNGVMVDDVIQSLPLTLLPGTEPTDDGDGADGNQTVGFGFVALAGIGDRVWIDTNDNGRQDNDEVGLAGVTIKLYNAEGVLLATVVTDATGQYHFLKLLPGQYYLGFTLPPGYAFTAENLGGDGTVDSDVDPTTGRTPLLQVDAGQLNVTLDVGIIKQPTALDEASEPLSSRPIYLPWISR